ncbi:Mitogen-activated protein kinase kinase kinase NPK1 [Platanthera guangdongensis]|uniref:mitogen-activated protein kinase kinase kinase n=1 Tax=Platanthera guangdongensis TaxID=2320717 RepID=A0ABR2MZH9_9ASPA
MTKLPEVSLQRMMPETKWEMRLHEGGVAIGDLAEQLCRAQSRLLYPSVRKFVKTSHFPGECAFASDALKFESLASAAVICSIRTLWNSGEATSASPRSSVAVFHRRPSSNWKTPFALLECCFSTQAPAEIFGPYQEKMQDIVGSVRRSLAFFSNPSTSDEGGGNRIAEKIGSYLRKSRVGSDKIRTPSPPSPARVAKNDDATPIWWRKGELIGCGAFGHVYMGMNLDSGELLAVKQVLLGTNNASKGTAQVRLFFSAKFQNTNLIFWSCKFLI